MKCKLSIFGAILLSIVSALPWSEKEYGYLVSSERTRDPDGGGGNIAVVIPTRNREFPFDGSVLDVEATIHVGIVGFRLSVSPLQMIEFLLGWTTLDVAQDDREERAASGIGIDNKRENGGPPPTDVPEQPTWRTNKKQPLPTNHPEK